MLLTPLRFNNWNSALRENTLFSPVSLFVQSFIYLSMNLWVFVYSAGHHLLLSLFIFLLNCLRFGYRELHQVGACILSYAKLLWRVSKAPLYRVAGNFVLSGNDAEEWKRLQSTFAKMDELVLSKSQLNKAVCLPKPCSCHEVTRYGQHQHSDFKTRRAGVPQQVHYKQPIENWAPPLPISHFPQGQRCPL